MKKNMFVLDAAITERLTGLLEGQGLDMRDLASLFWGLMMQVFTHRESLVFEKDIPGHDTITVDFDTSGGRTAMEALGLLHEAAASHPFYESLSFADEVYRGIEDGFGEADEAVFSLADGCLRLYVKTCAEDERHTLSELFSVLAGEIADHPDSPLNSLRRVSSIEEEEILELSKGEELPYDRGMVWLDLFKERVKEMPDALAISAKNGTLTYSELDAASDRLASYILKKGVKRGSFIAIKTDRVKEFAIGFLGAHKACCAYVPVDISYPEKRISYMLEDSDSAMILDEEGIARALETEPSELPGLSPDDPAYMIYTSGSTGKPKGAVLGQAGLMNYVLAVIRQNELSDRDRIGAHRSFSFDAHIQDFFPALSVGASVHIMPEAIRRDAGEIVAFLDEQKITGCSFTTSLGKLLITGHKLHLRYINVSGEAFTGVTAAKIPIINYYGPTEFTDESTWYRLEKGRSYNMVPIGRPVPNNYSFVLDPFLNLLPKGAPGELCMAGVQAAKGYYKRKEKTEAVFMECPFVPGIRMYRTGDIVRFLRDGNLLFLGRGDEQIKLNGYRIELGEIEALCGQYDGVEECAALIKELQGAKHLVLYYVTEKDRIVDESRLRSHMESGVLPQYMCPDIYMKLDEMPRLPNSKIDKRSMPLPDIRIETENVEPETALETHLLLAARKVLPGASFGITDDLFALGLTSIGAMKFITYANRLDYPTKYRVGDIMRYRTISALIEGSRRVCYLYNESYEPLKPVLVFIYGAAPVAGTLAMLDQWCDLFNVYIIEPIDSHYKVLFEKPDYQEIESMYLTVLDSLIPGGAEAIDGLSGFSWGGYAAYTIAYAISCRGGKKPFVLLGDTDLDERMRREVSKGQIPELPDNFFELTNGVITKIEALRKLRLISDINATVKRVPSYDGPVTMLDAALVKNDDDREAHEKKLRSLRKYAKDPVIVEFPHHNHDDLFYDASMAPVYLEEMKKLMERG